MSILEEFYNGNIVPAEKYIKRGSEYYKINEQLTSDIEKLLSQLNREEKQMHEKIYDSYIKLACISEKERFIDGFCLGVKLILEIGNFKSQNFTS